MKKVRDGLYEITLPMQQAVTPANTYVIVTPDRSLLIDTGNTSPESVSLLSTALSSLAIPPEKLDVFITHIHVDHFGAIESLWRPGMRVFAGVESFQEQRVDVETRFGLFFPLYDAFEQASGVTISPDEGLKYAYYIIKKDIPVTRLREGDVLTYGPYTLSVLETPGHERCELSLWDEAKGILFSGDLILKGSYTNIYPRDFTHDDISEYFETLQRIQSLPVSEAYAGHGSSLDAQELYDACEKAHNHHVRRIKEVMRVVSQGHYDLMDIVYHFTYSGQRRRWENYPVGFQWNMVCEIAAYLNHLVHQGKLIRRKNGQSWSFFAH